MAFKGGNDIKSYMMNVIWVVVGIVVVISVITATMGTVFTNLAYLLSNFTAQNIPLSNLLASGGVLYLLFGVGIIILIITLFLKLGDGFGKGRG